jgi:hypothetical protein
MKMMIQNEVRELCSTIEHAFNSASACITERTIVSEEISREVARFLDDRVAEQEIGEPYFGEKYQRLPYGPDRFLPIGNGSGDVRAAYVDGGNLEVLGAPNFSVQINRVYFNMFKGKERILPSSLPSRVEFYSATISDFRDDEIFYDTKVFPLKEEFSDLIPQDRHLSFSSTDRTVTVGTQRADIRQVASIARRFAEWELARHVVEKELDKGDMIIRDGTLQTSLTNETMYSSRAFEAATDKGVVFAGISKTSTLFTTTGLSLLGATQRLSEDFGVGGSWYIPIARGIDIQHNAFIYIVKLHENANYVFRFEIYGEQAKKMSDGDLDRITSVLAGNSRDISFPGYPYGLIDADSLARVGEHEIDKYQMMLLSEVSKLGKWKRISKHICSGDAHGVLDSLKG